MSVNYGSKRTVVGGHYGLRDWLVQETAPQPGWPGLDALAAARAYPARHGAILLAWRAALEALP